MIIKTNYDGRVIVDTKGQAAIARAKGTKRTPYNGKKPPPGWLAIEKIDGTSCTGCQLEEHGCGHVALCRKGFDNDKEYLYIHDSEEGRSIFAIARLTS